MADEVKVLGRIFEAFDLVVHPSDVHEAQVFQSLLAFEPLSGLGFNRMPDDIHERALRALELALLVVKEVC